MLFTGGSIVIPNDNEENADLVPTNADPFILEYVSNPANVDGKVAASVQQNVSLRTAACSQSTCTDKISYSASFV